MFKTILLFVLVLQVFSQERRVRINYNDEILLRNVSSTDKVESIVVKLRSLAGNDASVPIDVQLR